MVARRAGRRRNRGEAREDRVDADAGNALNLVEVPMELNDEG